MLKKSFVNLLQTALFFIIIKQSDFLDFYCLKFINL